MQLTIIQVEREEFLHSRILERSDRIKSDWLQISNDLKEIKKDKLYLRKAKTFEEYCKVFFDMGRNMAYKLVAASEVVENLDVYNCTHLPQTESQVRPLSKLEPELQRETWNEVLQENQTENITAKIIAEKVETRKELNQVVKEVKRENQPDTIFVQTPLTEKEILQRAKEITTKKKEENAIKLELKKEENARFLSADVADNKPTIHNSDCIEFLNTQKDNTFDLLITDPPYSTDVKNISFFAQNWVLLALSKVKKTGRAFICIGAYPIELNAYLSVLLGQDKFIVDNPIIWAYRNTLGVTPKMKYNLNYQVILHLYSKDSPPLDVSITNEMFNVMNINAPDGRLGNRYHVWQKPDELGMRLIKHTTKKNDKVLDCFCCTGTFPLMASKMGRIAIGCDNNAQNLEIAKKRGCTIV